MSQYDFGNLESPVSGTQLINTHLEPFRDALHSSHIGSSRPSYAVAGMIWVDNTTTPYVVNFFDGTDDIQIGTVNATTNIFTAKGNLQASGSGGIAIYNNTGTLIATMGAGGSTGVTWAGQQNFSGLVKANAKAAFATGGELTISSGSITVTASNHRVDTESDAASDDLSTIVGGADGEILIIRPQDDARTIVIKHGVGNISTQSGQDITLDDTDKSAMLRYDAVKTEWLEICSAGSSTSVIVAREEITGSPQTISFEDVFRLGYTYEVEFSNVEADGNAKIYAQLGTSGTSWISSNYNYTTDGIDNSNALEVSSSSAAGAFELSSSQISPNEKFNGKMHIQNPMNASCYTSLDCNLRYLPSGGTKIMRATCVGEQRNAAQATASLLIDLEGTNTFGGGTITIREYPL